MKCILYEVRNRIAAIRFNRPEIRNALDLEMRREMVTVLNQAAQDKNVRVVVIRGVGEHFCAGGSINDMQARNAFDAKEFAEVGIEAIQAMYYMKKPVITAVDGYAVGAGFSFVLASDLVIATTRARFSQKFITVGITPDFASTFFLPRIVGPTRAKELALTGRIVEAEEAWQMGIITELVSPEDLDKVVEERAAALASGPAKAIELTKRIINNSLEVDLKTAFDFELMGTALSMQSRDYLEAVDAFNQKRKPVFTGD